MTQTPPLPAENPDEFYSRVDAHINLSNAQHKLANIIDVGASMNFASARYAAWMSARSFTSGEKLMAEKDAMIAHFVGQYKLMLEDNIDDYVRNHAQLLPEFTSNKLGV